ncbi:MAG: DNA repair protein RadA [Myxococcota bacterium]
MAKPHSIFACTECGAQQPRWLGRCPECGAWSTLQQESVGGGSAEMPPQNLLAKVDQGAPKPLSLGEIDPEQAPRLSTGIPELDRVLGGGLVPGSVLLLAGEPGIGKSTLALQLAAALPGGARVLYVAGEESPEQIRLRADRLPTLPVNLVVLAETRVEELADPWRELDPAVVLVDSVQTLRTARVESAPGSVAQVRESASLLAAAARAQGAALVLVGHVTKEGAIAGPRVLEHLVDVVLQFEGDRGHAFRLLRAHKNRFGSTQEVGVFRMGPSGLEAVGNPSELFLAERSGGAPGSCVVPLLEGSRPMLVEIQALVAPAGYGTARRTAIGVEDGRVALLLAVLERRAGVDLASRDVYVNVVGGVRVSEPAADLALALALASSRLDIPLPDDVVACGEVGLGGEIRRVPRSDLRVAEALRLGFRRVLLPEAASELRGGAAAKALVGVRDLASALAWLRAEDRSTAT